MHAHCAEPLRSITSVVAVVAFSGHNDDPASVRATKHLKRGSCHRTTRSMNEFLNRLGRVSIDLVHFFRSDNGNQSPTVDLLGPRQRASTNRTEG